MTGDVQNGQATPDSNKNLRGNEAPAHGDSDPPGVHVTLPMQGYAPVENVDGEFTQVPAHRGKEVDNTAGGQDGKIIVMPKMSMFVCSH